MMVDVWGVLPYTKPEFRHNRIWLISFSGVPPIRGRRLEIRSRPQVSWKVHASKCIIMWLDLSRTRCTDGTKQQLGVSLIGAHQYPNMGQGQRFGNASVRLSGWRHSQRCADEAQKRYAREEERTQRWRRHATPLRPVHRYPSPAPRHTVYVHFERCCESQRGVSGSP